MSELDVEIREVIADGHQLPAGSASFLTGSTLEEVERSATELGKLVGERPDPEPEPVGAHNLIAAAIASKTQRKRALARLFSGEPPQAPRDASGRYTRMATDLGRGARKPVPPPPPTHDQTLTALFRSGEADAGHRLFPR